MRNVLTQDNYVYAEIFDKESGEKRWHKFDASISLPDNMYPKGTAVLSAVKYGKIKDIFGVPSTVGDPDKPDSTIIYTFDYLGQETDVEFKGFLTREQVIEEVL